GKSTDDKSVFAVSKGVKPIYLNGETGNKDNIDPHAWLSLDNGIQYVKNIQEQLIKADSSHKADYEKQGKTYLAQLEKLNKDSKDKFNDIP
ncbi:zinc ABC transporter substrate-binding protein, partial [Staphylococcus warneri]|uniref:metal ABC transporter solute-binding protein, Zn/Mn family n=1 Tax=Staphylococcus warneri TaxID=1292 RepID=UPI0030BB981F